jgi:hypothetical protein
MFLYEVDLELTMVKSCGESTHVGKCVEISGWKNIGRLAGKFSAKPHYGERNTEEVHGRWILLKITEISVTNSVNIISFTLIVCISSPGSSFGFKLSLLRRVCYLQIADIAPIINRLDKLVLSSIQCRASNLPSN